MSSSQPENYTRNVLTNYLTAIVLVATGFLVTPVLTSHLGIIGFGVWALVGSLIPYFELLELGLASSTITYVGKHLESGDEHLVNRTLNTSFFLLMVPGAVAAGLAVGVAILLPDIVHSIPHHYVGQARILLLLLAFDMVVSIPMDTFGGALIAKQRYDLLNVSLITVMLLQTLGWLVVLVLHGGLVDMGIVTVAISLCGQTARFIMARRLIPSLKVSLREFDRTILRSFAVMSGWFSLAEVSGAFIDGMDIIIVGIVVGVRGAAIFAVGQRLGTLPSKIMTPPTAVVIPHAARLAARDDRQGMRDVNTSVTRKVMALVMPATLALMLLATPIVQAWVGPSFHQSAQVVIILAGSVIAQAIGITPRAVMAGSGQPKAQSVVMGIEAVVHLCLGILLCRWFGVLGAPVTGLICIVALEGFILIPILYRKLEIPLSNQLYSIFRAHAVPAVVAGAIGWALVKWPLGTFVDHHSRLASVMVVTAAGLIVMMTYYGILFFTGMGRAERVGMVDWARRHVPLVRST